MKIERGTLSLTAMPTSGSAEIETQLLKKMMDDQHPMANTLVDVDGSASQLRYQHLQREKGLNWIPQIPGTTFRGRVDGLWLDRYAPQRLTVFEGKRLGRYDYGLLAGLSEALAYAERLDHASTNSKLTQLGISKEISERKTASIVAGSWDDRLFLACRRLLTLGGEELNDLLRPFFMAGFGNNKKSPSILAFFSLFVQEGSDPEPKRIQAQQEVASQAGNNLSWQFNTADGFWYGHNSNIKPYDPETLAVGVASNGKAFVAQPWLPQARFAWWPGMPPST